MTPESLLYAVAVARLIFAALAEEIGFRGILQGGLERHMRLSRAIAITPVVFVFAHFIVIPLFFASLVCIQYWDRGDTV
jgi:membrane protease YdiL (CAAX protease family)